MRHSMAVVLVALIGVLSRPGGAVAQDETPRQALERGSVLARQEKFDEAIGIWLGVLDKLDPEDQAAAERKLGLAFKRTGRLPEAWHYLSVYLDSSFGAGEGTAAGWLQEVESSLRQAHVKVTFNCSPGNLTLVIAASRPGEFTQSAIRPTLHKATSGQANPQSAIVWWFEPGKHMVQAEAPGYEARSVEVDVGAGGGTARMEIALVAVAPVKTIAGGPKGGGGPGGGIMVSKPAEPEKPSRVAEWTLIGSGLALGGAGAVFHGLGYSRNEELDAEYSDDSKHPYGPEAKKDYDAAFDEEVRPKEIAAYVLYGVGGAAVLAGIITYAVRDPGGTEEGRSALTVTPMGLPGGAGALMMFEF